MVNINRCILGFCIVLVLLFMLKYVKEHFSDTNKELGYNNLTIVTAYFRLIGHVV